MTTIERASSLSGFSVAVLTGPTRRRGVCLVRWAAMTAMRRKGHSFPAIGKVFNRDHSTVISGIRKGETYALFDDRYSAMVEALAA